MKFHNGDELTAEDVAYTIKFAADPANKIFSPEKVIWIDSVEVVDPYKVRIKAKQVSPMALNYIIQIPILPFNMVNAHLIKTDEGSILVDTGIPGSERKVERVLHKHGLTFKDINVEELPASDLELPEDR